MDDLKTTTQSVLLGSLDIGPPPILPDLTEDLEKYLTNPSSLEIHNFERSQRILPRKPRYDLCFSVDVCRVQTGVVVEHDWVTGQSQGFTEEYLQTTGKSAKNSTSLKRLPGPLQDGIWGSTTNYPFWPGGLDEPDIEKLKQEVPSELISFDSDLLTTAPGLSKGVSFDRKKADWLKSDLSLPSVVYLTDILGRCQEFDFAVDENEQTRNTKCADNKAEVDNHIAGYQLEEIVKLENAEKIKTAKSSEGEVKEEWAVLVDVMSPVKDFRKQIPTMALEFEFELDTFQKQAIIQLENHNNVFVAAHTSAGKTVVAEYAIALAKRHMTKAIYTSPIKALSNQKFRDFKDKFEDVGLVTGDVQIRTESSCLIMTTEILRSMLYNGSDVVRDLEWAIFDEVHYINDAERGVVWEEVLIMLPQHVKILMLSATVPNTKEFAEWIGRTKRKKMYVISTPKRPVPLEHYLYTGNSAKTSNEMFLLLDSQKNFLKEGHAKAVEAKKERASKSSQSFGAKGTRYSVNIKQEKNIWISIIDMLKKKDKMPAVAFTFSKKRIGDIAENLQSIDLTTNKEKSQIHMFFEKSVGILKPPDRKLPQVKIVRDLLQRGIGIHHSGVLPILKEVVEMLFQKGLVQILFATETFAMGVNMPARTVVFDTIRKHDGTNMRDILPGEYIQMAGRAGRRGLDSTGTVILLCKSDIPEMSDLHRMMMGMPTVLHSQFRITYTMILNLLRVEQLRIEDMMRKSFSEFHNQKHSSEHEERLKRLMEEMKNMADVFDYSGDLYAYYDACDEYHKLKSLIQAKVFSQNQGLKSLTPGRVVVVNNKKHRNTLGVILQTVPLKDKYFRTLVICEQKNDLSKSPIIDVTESCEDDFTLPKPMLGTVLFRPEGQCGQDVVELGIADFAVVTTKVIKVNADRIVEDVKKREMPRFKNDPPEQSTVLAGQELLRMTESNPNGLPNIDPIKDLNLQNLELVESFQRMKFLEDSFPRFQCINDPRFEENFKLHRKNMKLKEECNDLKFRLSDQSLTLLPEYNQRIEVLQYLKYIDKSNVVQMKGRIACEISTQELIITELIFENILSTLHPTEIAALLSCVVFEQRRCSEPNLNKELQECKKKFTDLATSIGDLQKRCGLQTSSEEYLEEFHFGLMEVVYEWARGMPFAEITNLTDVQEGIIVRCIQRLEEVIRDVYKASKIIGDPVLSKKMEEASHMIKRDIVFAASLYTQ